MVEKKEFTTVSEFKIDFSFRREVFFIIAGALMGAIAYVIPITVFAIEGGSSYYLTWIVFGHIAGVYSPITSVINCRIYAPCSYCNIYWYNSRAISIQDQYPKYKQTIKWVEIRTLCRIFSICYLCYTSSGICIRA